MNHIHIGVWFVLTVLLTLPLVNIPMRILAGHLAGTPIGRALAFAY